MAGEGERLVSLAEAATEVEEDVRRLVRFLRKAFPKGKNAAVDKTAQAALLHLKVMRNRLDELAAEFQAPAESSDWEAEIDGDVADEIQAIEEDIVNSSGSPARDEDTFGAAGSTAMEAEPTWTEAEAPDVGDLDDVLASLASTETPAQEITVEVSGEVSTSGESREALSRDESQESGDGEIRADEIFDAFQARAIEPAAPEEIDFEEFFKTLLAELDGELVSRRICIPTRGIISDLTVLAPGTLLHSILGGVFRHCISHFQAAGSLNIFTHQIRRDEQQYLLFNIIETHDNWLKLAPEERRIPSMGRDGAIGPARAEEEISELMQSFDGEFKVFAEPLLGAAYSFRLPVLTD